MDFVRVMNLELRISDKTLFIDTTGTQINNNNNINNVIPLED
jgi:hypothetical protein